MELLLHLTLLLKHYRDLCRLLIYAVVQINISALELDAPLLKIAELGTVSVAPGATPSNCASNPRLIASELLFSEEALVNSPRAFDTSLPDACNLASRSAILRK